MDHYSDALRTAKEVEIARRQEEIVAILEESKKYATGCDNLLKLRALKTRCEKITQPRSNKKKDDVTSNGTTSGEK